MKIDCGIIGLPNVGKSTLFNVLTNARIKVANFPFCTIQPNISVLCVPDARVSQLKDIVQSRNIVYGTIRFVDVAGLIKGAAQGIGMGNKILNDIRTTKVLCHVVRCFGNNEITHVFDDINPHRDINSVNTELVLFDILQCEQNICVLKKQYNFVNGNIATQLAILNKCLDHLYDGISLRDVRFDKTELMSIKKFSFLTIKPVIYIANIDAISVLDNVYLNKLRTFASNTNVPLLSCCALSCLSPSKNDNIEVITKQKEKILYDIVNAIFFVLNLRTFFTVNLNMTRAWVYIMGTTALEAAKKVHSDFKKRFIRAQVIDFNDFIIYKGELGVKKSGKARYESKDYCIKDGEVLKFLFKS